MKNKKTNVSRFVLGILLFLSTNSLFAEGNIRISPYRDTNYSIVSIKNPLESEVKLKIYNDEGNMYYSHKIEAKTIAQKLFDFSHLDDGTYKIVLASKDSNIEQSFEMKNNKLIAEEAKELFEKTIIRNDKNTLFVSYLSSDNQKFNFSISDKSGTEIFTEHYDSKPVFTKKFNVEALPEGEYKVRLVSNKKVYCYAFKK